MLNVVMCIIMALKVNKVEAMANITFGEALPKFKESLI
jgi:hypothetical protein